MSTNFRERELQKQFPQNSLNPEVKTRKSIMVIFAKITLNLVGIYKQMCGFEYIAEYKVW